MKMKEKAFKSSTKEKLPNQEKPSNEVRKRVMGESDKRDKIDNRIQILLVMFGFHKLGELTITISHCNFN